MKQTDVYCVLQSVLRAGWRLQIIYSFGSGFDWESSNDSYLLRANNQLMQTARVLRVSTTGILTDSDNFTM